MTAVSNFDRHWNIQELEGGAEVHVNYASRLGLRSTPLEMFIDFGFVPLELREARTGGPAVMTCMRLPTRPTPPSQLLNPPRMLWRWRWTTRTSRTRGTEGARLHRHEQRRHRAESVAGLHASGRTSHGGCSEVEIVAAGRQGLSRAAPQHS